MSDRVSDPDLTPPPGTGHQWTAPDRDPRSPAALRVRRGPDLRLVPVALGTWFIVALTVLQRTPLPAIGMAVVTVTLVAKRSLSPRRRRRRGRGAVQRSLELTGLCGTVWAGRAAWLVHRADEHPWSSGSQRHVRGVLELAGAPKEISGGSVLLPVRAPGLGTVPLFVTDDEYGSPASAGLLDLQPGTELLVSATVRDSDRPGVVPVSLSVTRSVDTVSAPDGWAAVTGHFREGLREAASPLPSVVGDLVPGMVVGDVSGRDPDIRVQFLATGLSHLTAVSGANVAVVTGAALVVATAVGAPVKVRVLVAAVCLVAFVLLVGPEPSVLRAAVTGAVGLVAVASARRTHAFAACSAAVLLLLAVDPGLAVDYAFVLSVVATVGIVALAPLVSRRLLQLWARWRCRRGLPGPLGWHLTACRLIGVSVAADVVTAPVIAHMTGVVSPVAVLANLVVGPAVPVITVLGMAAALCAGFWVPLGYPLLWLCALPAWWISTVAAVLAQAPVLSAEAGVPAAVAVTVCGTAVVVALVSYQHRSAAVATLAVLLLWTAGLIHRGVVTVGPYPVTSGGSGQFAAAFQRQWAEDLGRDFEHFPDWRVGVRAGPRGSEIIVPGGGTEPLVVVLTDDNAVLRDDAARQSAKHGDTQRPDLYVVTSCGRSRGMPSAARSGVPVAYPCRDGTVLLTPDGLHASGAG